MPEEEKVYCSMYSRNAELYHHGILGMKWGIQNGPPYPLGSNISTGSRLKNIFKNNKTNFEKALNKSWNDAEKIVKEECNKSQKLKKIVKDYNNSEAVRFGTKLKNFDSKMDFDLYIKPAIDYLIKKYPKDYDYFKNDMAEMHYEVVEFGLQNKPYSSFFYYCDKNGLDTQTEIKKYERLRNEFKKEATKISKEYLGNQYNKIDNKGFELGYMFENIAEDIYLEYIHAF